MTAPTAPTAWHRLIATFPLNGSSESQYEIHKLEVSNESIRVNPIDEYVVIDENGSENGSFPTLGEALKRCLNNCGWGPYQVRELPE